MVNKYLAKTFFCVKLEDDVLWLKLSPLSAEVGKISHDNVIDIVLIKFEADDDALAQWFSTMVSRGTFVFREFSPSMLPSNSSLYLYVFEHILFLFFV